MMPIFNEPTLRLAQMHHMLWYALTASLNLYVDPRHVNMISMVETALALGYR